MLKLTLFTAAVLAAGAASAVTVTSTPGAPDPGPLAGQSVLVDFDTAVAGITYAGSYTIDANNVSGQRAQPAGNTSAYFGVPGTNAGGDNATIDFTGYLASHAAFSTLSFYWGSIDSYNTLELIGSGLTGQTVFAGGDIYNPANGDQSAAATNRRVNFTFGAGETLTGLKLTSTGRAFEIDNIAVGGAVPEPATWAMMVLGFGLVGASVRRRTYALAA